MIKIVDRSTVPAKRGASAVTKRVMQEFEQLKHRLEGSKLAPYEAVMVVLDELPQGKPNRKNATLKLFAITKSYLKQKKLPYRAFTRNEAGTTAIYVASNG
jgi:hypothetical protein